MLLGLTVTFMMLIAITLIGILGYVMDRQVDHDEKKDGRSF
jgi:hypothetical protein